MDVVDNQSRTRFELSLGDDMAVADYHLGHGTIAFTHTEVPSHLRGRGIAATLVRGALDASRERGLRVIPSCSYVADFIERNPEYQDLLAR